MLFLRSARTLSIMRRLALIAVGAAVAAFILLPATAAWLRQPAPLPLPDPINLERDRAQRDTRATEARVQSKLLSGWRSRAPISGEWGRAATHGAQPILATPAHALPSSTATSEDDDDDSDQPASAIGEAGDGELGDD
jgi:hypothetical protein